MKEQIFFFIKVCIRKQKEQKHDNKKQYRSNLNNDKKQNRFDHWLFFLTVQGDIQTGYNEKKTSQSQLFFCSHPFFVSVDLQKSKRENKKISD